MLAMLLAIAATVANNTPQDEWAVVGGSLLGVAANNSISPRDHLRKHPAKHLRQPANLPKSQPNHAT
jgi:hypothetical protein